VCISESCSESLLSFGSFKEWLLHMQDTHGQRWHQDVHPQLLWKCALCLDASEVLTNPQVLYLHMQSTHRNLFRDTQLEIIVRQCKSPMRRPPDVCPLCCLRVEEVPEGQQSVVQYTGWSSECWRFNGAELA
jgi:hypothetical protein